MRDFVSLFAGAGGLDLGLEDAGWRCRYASDIDPHAVSTLQANKTARLSKGARFSETFIEQADVRTLSGSGILAAAGARRGDIPLLAGGPPCQSWSSAGHQLGFNDPRGQLWSDFVRLADELDVKYLVFENVRGLLTARGEDGVPGSALNMIRVRLLERGFHTTVSLLNAADFGLAQRRVRLFIIGYRDGDAPVFPTATHSKFDDDGLLAWVPLSSVLKGLPKPSLSEIIRPSQKLADELKDIPPGSGVKSMGKPEATRPGGHWGYKQGAFVTDPALPARTVTASSAQDWIRDPLHGIRRLTPRECAAIQTFPADYIWPKRAVDQYRLVGNSVPPKLAEIVGATLLAGSKQSSGNITPMSQSLIPLPAQLEAAIAYTKREEKANGHSRRMAPVLRRARVAAG